MDEFTHWRDSARTPRFFMVDYRAVLPFLLLIIGPKIFFWYILIFAVAATAFFGIIEYFGFTYTVALRWMRASFISGRYKKVRSWWK